MSGWEPRSAPVLARRGLPTRLHAADRGCWPARPEPRSLEPRRKSRSRARPDTVGEWVRRRVESGVGAVISGGFAMSLHPQQPIPSVPEQTARIARAAFPKGSPYLTLRDTLGTIFVDGHFADLYPKQGQPACPPWRLALITLMQFREGLSDRQAAEAVRARIDWKYLLGLELSDPGFDFSVLCEFRDRLLAGGAQERLLERVLEVARELGVLKARGRQRTDSTHVLAAVRTLNRLELVAETLRAALNATAAVAPDWLRALAPSAWYERYGRRIEDTRLPQGEAKREAYACQVGEDGFCLLEALAAPNAPEQLADLPAIQVLR